MKEIYIDGNDLLLKYMPEFSSVSELLDSIERKTNDGERLILQRTFHLLLSDIVINNDDRDDTIVIKIGEISPDKKFVFLNKQIFNISHIYAFGNNIDIKSKYLSKDSMSIVKHVSETCGHDIYI